MKEVKVLIEGMLKRIESIQKNLSVLKTIFNIDEVSEFTGLSKSTIYKFTHTGRIPFYKQAKHLFFDKAEIENWLKENKGFNLDETEKQAATYISLNKGGAK